jgi:hypothetical protein
MRELFLSRRGNYCKKGFGRINWLLVAPWVFFKIQILLDA